MRLATVVLFVLVLALSVSAFADFTLVGKIPAPIPYPSCGVLGMESAMGLLFIVVDTDTTDYLDLIDPGTGDVIDTYAWDKHVGEWPTFQAASYEGDYIFWVAEEGGDLYRFQWDDGVVTVLDTVSSWRFTVPTGMTFQPMYESLDANWVTESEVDSVFLVDIFGGVLGGRDLSGIPFMPYGMRPTSVSKLADHLYITGAENPDSVFEITGSGVRVAAHYLPGLSQMTPQAAAFHNGLYYVGGYDDSICVYSTGSYTGDVPQGPDVTVDIVPEGLSVGFDFVTRAGSLYVEVSPIDDCPAPGGVNFFGDFYDVATTAEFDYITTVEMMTNEPLPAGVMERRVRVFKRPSDTCSYWRDITVQELQIEEPMTVQPFRVNSRTLSEDDEFSIFTLGEDNRSPGFVIGLKYGYLEEAITYNQDSIPSATYNTLLDVLSNSETAYGAHRYSQAARLANRIADITHGTPEIPHKYEPGTDRINVAGRIIARAHTLAFSLDLLVQEVAFGAGGAKSKQPPSTAIESSPVNPLILGPNPSASGFRISLSGNSGHPVSVRVYSVKGELVRSLLESQIISGERSLTWDGLNKGGQAVSAGTYFIVISEGEKTTTRKVILRK